jgi:hypothetical protein
MVGPTDTNIANSKTMCSRLVLTFRFIFFSPILSSSFERILLQQCGYNAAYDKQPNACFSDMCSPSSPPFHLASAQCRDDIPFTARVTPCLKYLLHGFEACHQGLEIGTSSVADSSKFDIDVNDAELRSVHQVVSDQLVTEQLALTSTVSMSSQTTLLLAKPLIRAISMEEIEGQPALGSSSLAAKQVPARHRLSGACSAGLTLTLGRESCTMILWRNPTSRCETTVLILSAEG